MSARRGSLLGLIAGLWAGVRGSDRETRQFYAAYRLSEGEGVPPVGGAAEVDEGVFEAATCVHLN